MTSKLKVGIFARRAMVDQAHQTHGQKREQLFVYNCGTHYSNGHLVIFHTKIGNVRS